ncbi:MAG TPA: efflux RND transporter periplasmic adaptor subunit [Polyangiaceae bacterium]
MIHRQIPAFIVPLLLVGVLVPTACKRPSPLEKSAYASTSSEVTVAEPTSGINFKTATVRVGVRLSPPPLTARVTTVESLTEPVYSPLHGRVAAVKVHLGDRVKKGDRLLLVETPELPELTRQHQEARLSVALRQSTVDRLEQLVTARAVPEHDLAVARTELDTAKVDVQSSEAKLRSLAVTTAGDGAYWLTAERAGTVVELKAMPGSSVGPELDHPVCVVSDLSQVVVIGDMPQALAIGLEAGLSATIRIPGQVGTNISGIVQMVSGVVDSERQSVPVRVLVDNTKAQLRPNAFVELELKPKQDGETLLVPTSAVVTDGLDTAVFVKIGPASYRKRQVSVGRQSTEWTEINAGVAANEEVVTSNPLLLINALQDS